MIIVKTKNGDRFVNDKAVTMVEHDREKAVVNAYGDNGVFFHIENVEGVIYTNDVQPTSCTDEGSEIKRAMERLDELKELSGKISEDNMLLQRENEELKERIAQLEPKQDPGKWWPDNVDVVPISVLTCRIRSLRYDPGYSARLEKIFADNNIKSVGELLRIGRRDFMKYPHVGPGSVTRIEEALDDLFDIKGW